MLESSSTSREPRIMMTSFKSLNKCVDSWKAARGSGGSNVCLVQAAVAQAGSTVALIIIHIPVFTETDFIHSTSLCAGAKGTWQTPCSIFVRHGLPRDGSGYTD